MNKKILDACCGSRMFWFDKSNADVLFADIRSEDHILCDNRALSIKPDIICDFRNMPFEDNSFQMVVFDPPHLNKLGQDTWMAKKYGVLLPTWELDIKAGFDECMRVLKPNGTLIFKWNEIQVTLNKVLDIIKVQPLFGHTTGKHGKTIWMAFMKSDAMAQRNKIIMMVQVGDFVKYNGFEKDLEPAECIAQVIGHDEHCIYTAFIYPVDTATKYGGWEPAGVWNEWDKINTVQAFRIGFHPSRFIEVLPPGTIAQQTKLFN